MNIALPAPKQQYSRESVRDETAAPSTSNIPPKVSVVVPPYMHRTTFIPCAPEDFGDGGAFPEIHVVQYPLGLGRPGARSQAVVAVDVDEKGNVRYDAIIKQGAGRDKRMQTSLDDMREREGDEDVTALPAEDEETEATNKTRLALEALLNGKIKQSKPSSAVVIKEPEAPTYVRYTPNPNAPGSTGQTRIIRMVEAQVDPMEPPKHMLKKIPRGPPSPPPPVLHSPPRKLTVEDQQAWKVPPCISNWKNARGYTIPLDKRLAADGRGLQEATINNKFASLTEALYVAERKASEDLRVRDQIRRKMSIREKEDKERELRDLASRARMERAGVLHGEEAATHIEVESLDSRSSRGSSRSRSPSPDERRGYDAQRRSPVREPASRSTRSRSDSRERGVDQEEEDEAERTARVQRERLRIERRKERERELRLENMKGARKNKVDRDANRDVSEKMALNMHKGAGQLTGEAMYDSRLFNQSAGMDSGFGADDEYAAYSKPMFDRGEAGSMYRPKKDDADVYGDADAQLAKLSDTSRFKADKGFKGAEVGQKGGRDAPVQFEKVQTDPFGITDLVNPKKRARHDEDED